jgi:hypothetical protein
MTDADFITAGFNPTELTINQKKLINLSIDTSKDYQYWLYSLKKSGLNNYQIYLAKKLNK